MVSPKHQVEALLFSSGKTISIEQIAELSKLDKAKVTRALKALQKDYASRESAVEITSDNTGWKMTIRNSYIDLVKNVVADTELSRACMETLAIIAFMYPNTVQAEVVEKRGSNAYEHIKELEKLGFVKKEPSGRSYSIKLTEKFFEYFDVQGESDIRKIFKKAKMPEIPAPTDVDGMNVVDIPIKDKDPDEILGLEVVPVNDSPDIPEVLRQPEETAEEASAHQKFLENLDSKIDSISKKNDERDQDPVYQHILDEEQKEEPSTDDDLEEE
ncbi:SMC-Scp complex subunit ScpB [Candidatus Woesearchaeota archaeon]|nr:SMC-Scp complex subunit ScpB [Candidatus Woesearchaeota archaeon]